MDANNINHSQAPTDKIIIFDTTLRDGEQSAGAGLTVLEKLRIAKQLATLNIDVIEAGFAASSAGDFDAVNRIGQEVPGPTICSLARAIPADIEAAARALESAHKPRIHTFISSSDIHLMHQMRRDRESIMNMAVEAVRLAKQNVDDVEFSPMDATRTELEYLYAMLEATIAAGATTVNIPDTVGYSNPQEFGTLIANVIQNVPNIDQAIISVHCHNDLGMSAANSLAAVENGARQIEGCINGLGERAGNAALEEVIMAIKTRPDYYRVWTGINTKEIYNSSRLISSTFGFPVQYNKAIVGRNAFRHSSGIHQDGFLKQRTTFEIMEPESVGWRGEALVLGKLSGRAGLQARLKELGFQLTAQDMQDAFTAFKLLADTKREVTDVDLEALMQELNRSSDIHSAFSLEKIHVTCGNTVAPTAVISLRCPDDKIREQKCEGTGPVDAVFSAIDAITGEQQELAEFSITAITEGVDALGDVTVRIAKRDTIFSGRGSDNDIIIAAAKAYLNAINRSLIISNKVAPAESV